MLDNLTTHLTDMTVLHKNQHQLDQIKTQLGGPKEISLTNSGLPTMEDIEDAALEFESVFLNEMLKPMFEGVDADPLFGGGQTEEIFKDLMLDEYGKIIAERGSIGIAKFVKAEMIKIQESQGGLQQEAAPSPNTHSAAAQSYKTQTMTNTAQPSIQETVQ
jgi:Rod binding domain-containing protein